MIGVDVGAARIGVSRASLFARIAQPLPALMVNGHEVEELHSIARDEHATAFVVGLPISLEGTETQQTKAVRKFAKKLEVAALPVYFQNEALSSVRAEEALRDRGKPYTKADIDSWAAALILEDYMEQL